MTRPELTAHLQSLPFNERRTLAGIPVTRTSAGYSVDGGQPVSVKVAATLIDNLRRLRA
jgi:hypothetical protein